MMNGVLMATKEQIDGLKPETTHCVYDGKPGCACGCLGTYSYNPVFQAESGKHRGYDIADKELNQSEIAPAAPEVDLERAPANHLPSWKECKLIIENYEFRQRAKAGLEGAVLDTPPTTPEPTAIHRFIYEYDDADSYRSEWFMHRLELALIAHDAKVRREALERVHPKPGDFDLSLKLLTIIGVILGIAGTLFVLVTLPPLTPVTVIILLLLLIWSKK